MTKSVLALLVLSGFVLGACTPASQTTEEAAGTTETAPAPGVDQAAPDGEAMMEGEGEMMAEADLEIEASNFEYSVESISASAGETVTVTMTSTEGMHDFVIDELGVQSEVIQAGEETTFTIEIPEDAEVGTEYAFYCSIGNHRAMGMEGTLVIE